MKKHSFIVPVPSESVYVENQRVTHANKLLNDLVVQNILQEYTLTVRTERGKGNPEIILILIFKSKKRVEIREDILKKHSFLPRTLGASEFIDNNNLSAKLNVIFGTIFCSTYRDSTSAVFYAGVLNGIANNLQELTSGSFEQDEGKANSENLLDRITGPEEVQYIHQQFIQSDNGKLKFSFTLLGGYMQSDSKIGFSVETNGMVAVYLNAKPIGNIPKGIAAKLVEFYQSTVGRIYIEDKENELMIIK